MVRRMRELRVVKNENGMINVVSFVKVCPVLDLVFRGRG